jgi:proton-coupled amino acid transporter
MMAIIRSLLLSFRAIGYLAFGAKTQGSVTANLGNGITADIAKSLLSFSLLLTFRIQLYPMIEILKIRSNLVNATKHKEPKRNILRMSLVVGATTIAIAVPHFGLFVGLIGSMGSSGLAFILLALFHLKLFGSNYLSGRS